MEKPGLNMDGDKGKQDDCITWTETLQPDKTKLDFSNEIPDSVYTRGSDRSFACSLL